MEHMFTTFFCWHGYVGYEDSGALEILSFCNNMLLFFYMYSPYIQILENPL